MIDYYKLLGVSQTATHDEIQKAYRKMMRLYHPDVNKSPDADKMAKTINNARDTLLDPTARKQYDEHLSQLKQEQKTNYTNSMNKKKKASSTHQTYTQNQPTYNNQSQETRNTDYNDNTNNRDSSTNQNDQYVYLTKWQAFFMWLRHSKRNIFVKAIGCIIIAQFWIPFRVLQLLRLPLIFGMAILTKLSYLLAGLGAFVLFLNLVFATGFFEHDNLFNELILYFAEFFLPAIIFSTMNIWLPELLVKLDNLESWIITKIINF